jgi:V/A-type H+/Na+-transporting ATPase subunit E
MKEMDNVSKKIIDDAEAAARKIISEAEEKTSGIISEAGNKVKEIIEEGRARAEKHYESTYAIEYDRVRAAFEQKLLLARLELIEGVIAAAKKRLSGLDRDGWKKFLKKMADELDIKGGKYIIGKNQDSVDSSLVETIKGLEPDDTGPDFERGIKISGDKTETFLYPPAYLDTDIENLKMEIAAFLFDGEK